MHLICPPKFCVNVVFNFSWDGCNTQENKKQRLCKNLGANKVHYGKCGSGVKPTYLTLCGKVSYCCSPSTISSMVRKQLSLLTCNILLLPHGAPDDICNKLEVIIDYGSAFVTYGKITKMKSSRKESSFPAKVPLIILIGEANLQSPLTARKFLL